MPPTRRATKGEAQGGEKHAEAMPHKSRQAEFTMTGLFGETDLPVILGEDGGVQAAMTGTKDWLASLAEVATVVIGVLDRPGVPGVLGVPGRSGQRGVPARPGVPVREAKPIGVAQPRSGKGARG